ncbi:hypothetical protein POM88_021210 [Heracleum sosnowskyi]|uniref:Uncharacterized protein n=1 Tax=Heracleum sosnowskyi TaxID=360622 RepID=A0AAD8MNR8_9APIA|nr:hypothetical protein POM88_021210 [Heracleum sosnowskyi]
MACYCTNSFHRKIATASLHQTTDSHREVSGATSISFDDSILRKEFNSPHGVSVTATNMLARNSLDEKYGKSSKSNIERKSKGWISFRVSSKEPCINTEALVPQLPSYDTTENPLAMSRPQIIGQAH